MATPIGHGLLAVLATRFFDADRRTVRIGFALAVFATIAPDLDFLPGILVGDVNRFHRGASHSMGAVVIFGAVATVAAGAFGLNRMRIGLAAAMLYMSHLGLDLLAVDGSPPYGQPLLWPLSDQHHAMQSPVLSSISHGSADGSLGPFLTSVFSAHNLRAIAREIVVVGPLVAVLWFVLGLRTSTPRGAVHGRSEPVRARDGTE